MAGMTILENGGRRVMNSRPFERKRENKERRRKREERKGDMTKNVQRHRVMLSG